MEPGSGPRVLVVNDDPGVRDLLAYILRPWGYRAVAAEPAGALASAESWRGGPDLLLIDLEMTGVSAIALARTFVRRWPGVSILFLSGRGEDLSDSERAAVGGAGVLPKPFDIENMRSRIAAVVEERNRREMGDLVGPVDDLGEGSCVSRYRLLLAEDHEGMRRRMRRMLEPNHDVVGEVADGAAVTDAVRDLQPDILLLDITMPSMNGFEVLRQLARESTPVKVLFVTQHADPVYVEEARRSGAAGYVLKTQLRTDLAPAIQQVGEGGSYISASLRGPGFQPAPSRP